MDSYIWTVAVVMGITLVIAFAMTFVRPYIEYLVERYAAALGVSVPGSLRREIAARTAARQRGSIIGAALTIAGTLLLLSGQPSYSESPYVPFFFAGGLFAGVALGGAIAGAGYRAPHNVDAVKVARAGAVSLRDYIAPIERSGARIVVALSVAVLVASLLVSGADNALFAIIMTTLAVFSLVFFEVAGRSIIARSQPAHSSTELAWDDAVRSTLLRTLVTAPLALGGYAAVLGAVELTSLLEPAVAASVVFLVILAGLAVLVASIVTKPQSYFVRRLWPDGMPSMVTPATTVPSR